MRSDGFKVGSLSLACALLLGCDSVDVAGVVRDESTQRPISGATVRIGDDTTSTDSSGFYHMTVDADDDDAQRVNIQAPGYMAVSDVRLIDEDVDPARIDFDLKAEPGNTHSYVAPGDKAPTQAPVDVDINANARSDSGTPADHQRVQVKPGTPNSRANLGGGARQDSGSDKR
jgi:hypothetical protein